MKFTAFESSADEVVEVVEVVEMLFE